MTDKTESVVDVMARAATGPFTCQQEREANARAELSALKNAGYAVVPVETITDLCDELEAEVRERYGNDARLRHKLDRDMITVREARAMIQAATGGE